MNFIETIFRISPDNGTGLAEVLIFLALIMIPIGYFLSRAVKTNRTKKQFPAQ